MTVTNIIHNVKQKKLLLAWLVNTLLFTAIVLFACPVYHSGDELGMAQMLGGGQGMPPSGCLPFLYGMPFFFNIPLKQLFLHYPTVNWFSLLLLLPQYLSGIIFYYLLLSRKDFVTATLGYLLLFTVFGSWMVLYLNISSTSIVCAIAGLALAWHYFQQQAVRPILLTSSMLIIIIGALIRLHTLLPVFVVAAPLFLLLPGVRKKLMALGFLAITFALVILLFKAQDRYYTTYCPEWKQEEAYRKAKYDNINYYRDTSTARVAPYEEEAAMLSGLMLFDTTYPSTQTLYTIAQRSVTAMPASVFFSKATWYWSFINNRIFLLALALAFALFYSGRKERYAAMAAILIGLLSIGYIMMFRKLPEFIIPGITFTIVYFIVLTNSHTFTKNIYWKAAAAILFTILLAWALLRAYKTNRHNATSFQQFRLMYQELSNHPDKLFINVGDGESFGYFYCFATPASYPFKNILFIDHPVTARQPALLSNFGLEDIKKAPLLDNVYFRGPVKPVLTRYFSKVLNRPVSYSDTIPGFKHSAIRKLIVQ